jgi:uncharacterized protein (TIGR00369 family)
VPDAPPDAAVDPAGLDRVRALVSGERELPGMWRTMGMRPVAAGPGTARVAVVVGARHANGSAIAHGGLVATVIDSAAGMAMSTTLPPGRRISTVDLKVDYHRPVLLDGQTVVCDGEVVHPGRTVGHAVATVRVGGRVVATGRAVFAIREVGGDQGVFTG